MITSVETSLFMPRIHLVLFLETLKDSKSVSGYTDYSNGRKDGQTDQAFYYKRLVSFASNQPEPMWFALICKLPLN